jgi:DUF4097 and DUF4098 domain-containing protein YvlB
MSARKVALLLLILGFGGAVETAWSVRNHIDVGPFGCRVLGGRFYGNSYDFDEESQYAVGAGARVEIVNAFGAVRMHAGSPGEVRVRLQKVVYLDTRERAREFASRIALKADNAGTRLQLGTNRDEAFGGRDDVGFETHFDVTVPPGTAVLVRNEHGPVDLRDVAAADVESAFDSLRLEHAAGPVTLKSRHGDVFVSNVEGALEITSRHGDVEVRDVAGRVVADVQHGDVTASRLGGLKLVGAHGGVSVETVKGDVDVATEHGPVTVKNVEGKASLATSFDHVDVEKVAGDAQLKAEHGEVKAVDVKGALVAEASFDRVYLERIGGPVEVKVEHGGVEAHRLEMGARVKASGDAIALLGFAGPLEIEAQRGSVRLVPSGPITDAVSVTAGHGEITLEVPAGSRFDLEARARHGEVRADLPGLAITSSEHESLTAKVAGGGKLVKLLAEGGDVTLESRAPAAKAE